MKQVIIYIISLCLFLLISNCVSDDTTRLPKLEEVQPVIDTTKLTTFSAIKSRYEQAFANGNQLARIGPNETLYIKGYVISSDQSGNFFKELHVQNTTKATGTKQDPKLGIKILINAPALYQYYTFGQEVYIKLNGLSIGKTNGVLTLGKGPTSTIGQIQEFEYRDIVIRTLKIETIEPKVFQHLSELTKADLNTWIKLENVQFNKKERSKTYAGEAEDVFSGFRWIESCLENTEIRLQTSTFSDFKSLSVSQGKGSIKGVYKRDFTDSYNVLSVNNSANISMDDLKRCDPVELDCGLANTAGGTVLFQENFEDQPPNKIVSGNGWINVNEEGTRFWETFTSSGSSPSLGTSARIESFSSGDSRTISWLITPKIDVTANQKVVLNFKTSNSFADGSDLEILFSTDWNGKQETLSKANWGVLSAAYVVNDTDNFTKWFNSGNVKLSCASSALYIAFKYTGSGDEENDGTFELDDIVITAD